MQRVVVWLVAVGVVSCADSQARAGTVWQWTHDAEGGGWANVFDGGPPVFARGTTGGPASWDMTFSALDYTRLGMLGAIFGASGGSGVVALPESFSFGADLATDYIVEPRPDADRPGGEGEGWVRSVVEFVMPVDELEWLADVDIRDTSFFEGSMLSVVENVTTSMVLAEITDEPGFFTTLRGQAGDVIRVTTEIAGGGAVPEGTFGYWMYRARLSMSFRIPEPASAVLVVVGTFLLSRPPGRGVSTRSTLVPAILPPRKLGVSRCTG